MAINNVTGPTNLNIQTIDTDGDGAVDQGQIKKETGSVSSFDSFNLKLKICYWINRAGIYLNSILISIIIYGYAEAEISKLAWRQANKWRLAASVRIPGYSSSFISICICYFVCITFTCTPFNPSRYWTISLKIMSFTIIWPYSYF